MIGPYNEEDLPPIVRKANQAMKQAAKAAIEEQVAHIEAVHGLSG